jgi:hypothetical protein
LVRVGLFEVDLDRLIVLVEDGEHEEAMRQLRGLDDDAALRLVEGACKVGDAELRLWICGAAAERLGAAAVPFLRNAALHDRHPDVSTKPATPCWS